MTWDDLEPGTWMTWNTRHKKERMQTELNLEPGCNVFIMKDGRPVLNKKFFPIFLKNQSPMV
jgi:hypothetical protein